MRLATGLIFAGLIYGSTPTTVSPGAHVRFQIPMILAATPSAPYTCDVDAVGTVVYVDDTDDVLGGRFCFCGRIADGSYDWLDQTAVSLVTGLNTACPFF